MIRGFKLVHVGVKGVYIQISDIFSLSRIKQYNDQIVKYTVVNELKQP